MRALFLPDPVAVKELRGVSRRWQTYVGRCLFVAITAYLLYEYWKQAWRGVAGSTPSVSISQVAGLGRAIFIRCDVVSLLLTVASAVIAGSDMLTREIRSGTLGLLFLTPLTPRRVVFGKWKGAMMIAFSLYLCSVPVSAIAVYLGGVGPVDLLRSAAFTMSLAAVGAAVALSFSARLQSAGAAAAATIPFLLLLAGVLLFADWVATVIYRVYVDSSAVLGHGGLVTAVIAGLFSLGYLRRAVRRVEERMGVLSGAVELARERRALALEDLRDERKSVPRRILRTWRAVWEDNPLLWKEFTLRPALRIREDWRARCYVILFSFFLLSWVISGVNNGAGFFQAWGAFFTVISLASGSLLFAPEKEGRQWLLLLSTPVTAAQIVRAKLLCGLIFPEALGMIVLYLMCLAVWLGFQTLETIALAGAATTVFLLFAYALAAAASLRARTARSAFVFAAGVVAVLLTVPPLLSAAVRPMGFSRDFAWHEIWNWVEALDPIALLGLLDIEHHYPRSLSPLAAERALRFFTIYLPATLLLPVEMVLRFRRIAVRA